ncbi:MAG: DUF3352 domain-containing protein [Oscillatoriales cyanobacterium SM2_2_1]|nr:DUF3352 domain-containing protein [Oscillatoriales cyanobacterium SM2_2_1]
MTQGSRSRLQPRAKRPPLWIFGVGGLVGILGGAATAFFLLWQQKDGDGNVLSVARLIPQDAQVVMAFNSSAQPWETLRQFGTPDSQRLIGDGLEQSPLNAILRQSGTEYAKDVQPWLYGSVVTVLVNDPKQPNGAPETLVIAPTRDRTLSNAFLSRYRDALTQQGAKFTPQAYDGVNYFESPAPNPNSRLIAADLDGRYVVLSTSTALFQRTVAVYRGKQPNLRDRPGFEQFFAPKTTSLAEPLVQVYLDGAIALEFLGATTRLNFGDPLISQSRRELNAITMAVGTQKEGIRLEVTTYLKDRGGTLPGTIQVAEGVPLQLLPQETFLLISGTNLAQSWQALVAQAKGNSASEQMLDQIRKAIKDSTDLDLEKEILPWTTREFAIAAVPNNQGILSNPGFGLIVLAQTGDRNGTKAFFDKLDAAARSSNGGLLPPGIEPSIQKIGETPISAWQVGNVTVAQHGFLGQDVAFWAMGTLGSEFVPRPARPLSDSRPFAIFTTGLPRTNGGYFYLNMGSTLTIIERLIPPEVKSNPGYTQTRAVLDAIQGIAVTNTNLSDRATRLEFLFTLKPTPGN